MRYLLIALFTLVPAEAFACSCARGGAWVSDSLKGAIVFEGRALESVWIKDQGPTKFVNTRTKIEIEKAYADGLDDVETIYHHSVGATCGVTFQMGTAEYVYANRLETGELVTSYCSRPHVPKITLLKYLEDGTDIFIPDKYGCKYRDDPIRFPRKDQKPPPPNVNCDYWSDTADKQRRAEMAAWNKKKWDAIKKKK